LVQVAALLLLKLTTVVASKEKVMQLGLNIATKLLLYVRFTVKAKSHYLQLIIVAQTMEAGKLIKRSYFQTINLPYIKTKLLKI
jgi:hypothetical protein